MKTKTAAGRAPAKRKSAPGMVGIVGLGYVGLPLAAAFARAGLPVLGFDSDEKKTASVNAGRSYIRHIPSREVAALLRSGGRATSRPEDLAGADSILVCVPTPLSKHREPDMSHVEAAADMLAGVVRKGQLICLESTTYPGTTREILLPRLERGGLRGGRDFNLAYSPEREDPGTAGHSANAIPKVVGGLTPACLARARELYGRVAPATVPVSSLETAEATKLMENIFRCVNIALVNELKQVFARMGLDIWEVVEAASSKPFGYMPFYPGPGLGGHCIPIDPFYLTWKAREFGASARFIELAGEVNVSKPGYVLGRVAEVRKRGGKSLRGSRPLLVGLAYKPDVDDVRESPSLRLMELFSGQGAEVDYHDPLVPAMPGNGGRKSVPLSAARLRRCDAVVIATNHRDVDYALIGREAKLVVDTRNAMHGVAGVRARVAKA